MKKSDYERRRKKRFEEWKKKKRILIKEIKTRSFR
jgi:hypothetical protein